MININKCFKKLCIDFKIIKDDKYHYLKTGIFDLQRTVMNDYCYRDYQATYTPTSAEAVYTNNFNITASAATNVSNAMTTRERPYERLMRWRMGYNR